METELTTIQLGNKKKLIYHDWVKLIEAPLSRFNETANTLIIL